MLFKEEGFMSDLDYLVEINHGTTVYQVPTTIDTLELALKRVGAGWGQGYMQHPNKDGGTDYCLMGAISYNRDEHYLQVHPVAFTFVQQALREYIDAHEALQLSRFDDVVFFNDHPDTTHADVLAVIQRAYDLALLFEEEV